MVNTT